MWHHHDCPVSTWAAPFCTSWLYDWNQTAFFCRQVVILVHKKANLLPPDFSCSVEYDSQFYLFYHKDSLTCLCKVFVLYESSQAKISNFATKGLWDQNVGCPEVSVDEVHSLNVCHPFSNLGEIVNSEHIWWWNNPKVILLNGRGEFLGLVRDKESHIFLFLSGFFLKNCKLVPSYFCIS